MSSVIVIGNGFDLNLGLETGYTHFVKSENFNSLVDSGNELCIYLKGKHELQNWIDIENELKVYSREIYNNEDRKPFKQEYLDLRQALCDYLNGLDLSKIDKTSRAYNIIESIRDVVLILNFNYTDSLNYILELEGMANYTILNIHGRAKNNQIVFGVEDRARINDKDTFLKKSTCTWNKMVDIDDYLSKDNIIIFLGYSLGETDHHYFDNFFHTACLRNTQMGAKQIAITHYGADGFDDIMRQVDTLTSNQIHKLRSNNELQTIDLAKQYENH
jgi:hypothetical protein